jgi:hypothetical protein
VVPGNGGGEEERRQGAPIHRLQPFSRLELARSHIGGLEVQENNFRLLLFLVRK